MFHVKHILNYSTELDSSFFSSLACSFTSISDESSEFSSKSSFLDKDTVATINIGSSKTEVSIFTQGIITSSFLLTLGSDVIEQDLSYLYNIDIEKARKLKDMFILLDKDLVSDNEVYETKDNSNIRIKINQYEASDVASKKIREILEKAKKELNLLTKKEIRYIIISGGITNIPGFSNIAKDVFGDTAITKELDVIGVRNNSYSSSYGMIKYFIEKLKLRGREYTMFNEDKEYKLVEERKIVKDLVLVSSLSIFSIIRRISYGIRNRSISKD